MKKWIPSMEQLETYEELLKEQNKVRRKILRNRIKEERKKARGVTLPDLIVPKYVRVKKNIKLYHFKSYREYQTKVKELRRLYGRGLVSYYTETYKREILKGWRESIDTAIKESGFAVGEFVKPEGRGGYYSREQIEYYKDLGRYMELYNRLNAMNPEKFQDMYANGYITPLKYIYREMIQGGSVGSGISFLDEQNSLIDVYNGRARLK